MRARFSLRGHVPAAVLAAAAFGVAGAAAIFVVASTHASASGTCGFYWTGKTSTEWNLKGNWSASPNGSAASKVPGSADYVCMSPGIAAGSMPVISTANATVAGIDFTNDTTGGNGTLTIDNFTFNSGSGASGASNIASLFLEGGTLTGTTSAVNASLDSGSLTVKTTTVTLTGTSTIGDPSVGDHLVNAGTLTHTGNMSYISVTTGGTFENAGSFVEHDTSDGINWDHTASDSVVNDLGATWTLTAGNGHADSIYPPFQNNGTVSLTSGTLNVFNGDPGSTTDVGTWQPGAGTVVDISSSSPRREAATGAVVSGAGTFEVDSGTVSFVSGSTLSNLFLNGGAVSGTTSIATATLTSGALSSPGTVTLTGTSTIGDPSVTDSLVNAGTLTHTGNVGYIYLYNGGALENAGSFVEHDTSDGINSDGTASDSVVNDLGATWTLTAGNGHADTIYPPFQNNGTVSLTSGTLNVIGGDPGSTSDAGTWQPGAGTVLDIDGSATRREAGTGAVVSGAGTFEVDAGPVSFVAGSTLSNLFLNGGTVSGTTSIASATLTSGTLSSPGTVTLTGTSTIGDPSVGDHLFNTGTLTHTGNVGFIYLYNGGTLENAGGFVEHDSADGIYWDSTAGDSVVNDLGATWTLTAGSGNADYIYPPFQNNGTVSLTSGTLNVFNGDPGSTSDAGTWQLGTGTVVDISSGSPRREAGIGPVVSGAGTFEIDSGTVSFVSGSTLSNLFLNGGTVSGTTSIASATLTNGLLSSPGTVTLTGTSTIGDPSIADSLVNAGTLTHTGNVGYITLSSGGTLENAGGFVEDDTSDGISWDSASSDLVTNDAGASWTVSAGNGHTDTVYPPVQNNGTITVTSGTLNLLALNNLSAGGTLTGGNFAVTAGTIALPNTVTTNAASISIGPTGVISSGGTSVIPSIASNSGTLTLDRSETLPNPLANSGSVTVKAATLQVKAFTQTAGTTTVTGGATLKANTGSGAIAINGGTLTGTGTVLGNVSGNGVIQPSTPAGTLTVTGTFAPGSGGTLDADLGSTGSTLLAVSGAVTLSGGTLAITTDSGFTPTVGTVYTVLSGASRTGTFGTVTGLPAASLGYGYQVAYTGTSVTITVIPSVSIADTMVAQLPSSSTTANFTVTLSAAFSQQVTVDYATADGSATAGSDYTAASGTVTFLAGATSEQVSVTVLADGACDPNEMFTVGLTNPTNAVIQRGTATGTITNSSPCVTVTSITPSAVGQGASKLKAVVKGSGFDPTTANNTVTFSGTGVTATVTSATTTQLNIKLTVKSNASTGSRDVTVTSDGNGATCTGCLTVDLGPHVSSVSPNTLATGATSVQVTVNGTNFAGKVKVSFSGAKGTPTVKVNKVTSVTPTAITVLVTVAQGTVGSTNDAYTVKVVNGDGGTVSVKNAFSVETGPTFTSIMPPTISRGSSGVAVTLTGTGFVTGMTVNAPSGVTITITSVSPDGTSASGTMSAASNATTGNNLPVTVVEPASAGSGEATLNGLTVT